ncbi:MAG: AMP-dependent synthetase, partial [bacterium]|nr:AMP-dependent synthetase [bacterium]
MIPSTSQVPSDVSKPVRETTVGGTLREAAELSPEAIGLVSRGIASASRREWSFGSMLQESEQLARALLGRFDPGDRVGIWA